MAPAILVFTIGTTEGIAQGFAERARILGGLHEVISSLGEGTTVIVRIELKDR